MPNPTGAQVIAKALQGLGVTVIFGLVGIPVAEIAEEAINLGIRFIGFRNEQACSYAATAYGYLTGKPGVCLLVGGPGILHGMAGVGNASANSWPTLILGGNSEQGLNGKGGFQEMDSVALLKPHTKMAMQPSSNDPYTIVHAVQRAYRICWYGRPGPAYVDLPADLIMSPTTSSKTKLKLLPNPVPSPPRPATNQSEIQAAASLLRNAAAPLVVIGKGAAYSHTEIILRTLIDDHNIPFLPTPMGKGVIPDSHPLNTSSARSTALKKADCILLLGARLNWILHYGEPPKFNPNVKIIQIDISAEDLSRVNGIGEPSLSLFGDIPTILHQLHFALKIPTTYRCLATPTLLPNSTNPYISTLAHSATLNNEALQLRSLTPTSSSTPLTYERAYHIISTTLNTYSPPSKGEIVLIAEGANTMDISRSCFPIHHPRQRLDAGTNATMGVGGGYAVAAWAAYNMPQPGPAYGEPPHQETLLAGQKKRVVCLMGDSAFGFSGMEIETMARHKMPVLIFVMNNSGIYHGDSLDKEDWEAKQADTVKGKTKGKRKGLRGTTLLWETRYEKMAEMVGGVGMFVRTEEELERAVRVGWEEGDVEGKTTDGKKGKGRVVIVNVVIEAGLGKSIAFAWEQAKESGGISVDRSMAKDAKL